MDSIEEFRDETRAWLEENCPSGARQPGQIPTGSTKINIQDTDTRTWLDRMIEKGWTTPTWPKEYGGGGLSNTEYMTLIQEMRRINARAPLGGMGVSLIGPTLLEYGTAEQKERHIPRIIRAEVGWCQGYSEPSSGSDLASLQTRAVEDGDDFIINGTKIWTAGAHRADHIMVLTRTDPDAPKHRGINFLLCDMNTPGLTVNPIVNMAGDHNFNMITFDNVRVPKKNLVGEQDRGWYVGATLLDFERSGVDYSAGARKTLEELTDYSKSNSLNGKLLADNEVVRNRLADLAIEVDVSRLISYNIAWMQSEGLVPNKESSMGKVFGTELQQHISQVGMQMLGLHGQLAPGSKHAALNGRINHMSLSNVSETIAAGTSEIQRNIIASRGLGLPRG